MPTTMSTREEIDALTRMQDEMRRMRDCRPAGSVIRQHYNSALDRLDVLISKCIEERDLGTLPEEKRPGPGPSRA